MNDYILHKLSEGFIITSLSEISNGEYYLTDKKELEQFLNTGYNGKNFNKVIAQQDQIIFSALSEEEQKKIGLI